MLDPLVAKNTDFQNGQSGNVNWFITRSAKSSQIIWPMEPRNG